jgi:hypothetical protein
MRPRAITGDSVPALRDPDDLRRFAAQDWAAAGRDKELYWRDWKKQHGPAAGIRIADELRKQALAQKPGWPSDQERAEDLATHLRVLEELDRIPPRRRRAPR